MDVSTICLLMDAKVDIMVSIYTDSLTDTVPVSKLIKLLKYLRPKYKTPRYSTLI